MNPTNLAVSIKPKSSLSIFEDWLDFRNMSRVNMTVFVHCLESGRFMILGSTRSLTAIFLDAAMCSTA